MSVPRPGAQLRNASKMTNTALSTEHTVRCVVRPVEGPTFFRYADGQVGEQVHLFNRKGASVRVMVDGQPVIEKTVWQKTRFSHSFPLYSWKLKRTSAKLKEVTVEHQKVLGGVAELEDSSAVSISSRRGAAEVAVRSDASRDAAWSRTVKGGTASRACL